MQLVTVTLFYWEQSAISVLREGVEVIIFYMGMIGSIKTQDFIIGIVIAIVILIIFALLFRFMSS